MPLRSRLGPHPDHILIGGTGRAGTTLLVQYFTALGFDTGFTSDQARRRVDPISHGGLEHSLKRGNLAYVSKSPYYFQRLDQHLDSGDLQVRCCIVPVRDLFDAAESRRSVSKRAAESGKDPLKHPGGMIKARRGSGKQEEKLAIGFYKLLHTLAVHSIPVFMTPFPQFARDHEVLYASLHDILVEHGVDQDESLAAFRSVVKEDLISSFEEAQSLGQPGPEVGEG